MRARRRACETRTACRATTPAPPGVVVGFVRGTSCEENVMPLRNGRRVAVVAGCRTPFCKSGTSLKDAPAGDLARVVTRELLERTSPGPAEVDAVVFGQGLPAAV